MEQEPTLAAHPEEGPGNLVVLGLISILAVVPTLLGDPPIYESLGAPIFRSKAIETGPRKSQA
jgi:hypothetical protein